ncbi:MAG TPA: N,N'-diacetylchitobiose phosphorylase, partial [Candidatus Marinimicrobia bacterium]|nr:N,N'-diacetylchitobiose phosphorylase [Candidatus Neomarinimicrobiota bacterium]
SRYSPRAGASRLPWLTGAAAWSYYTATQYILGIQPDYFGLRIDPCLPSNWKEIRIMRRFRNKMFNILIKNPNGAQKGIRKLIINNQDLTGNLIPLDIIQNENKVVVEMQ